MIKIRYNDTQLRFNSANGNYEIIHKGFSWVSDGRKPYIEIRRKKTLSFQITELLQDILNFPFQAKNCLLQLSVQLK